MVKKMVIDTTRTQAFTLVELMVVVLILGALAFVAIPRIGESSTTAKINACDTNIKVINKQFELYKAGTGDWPNNYNQLKTNTDYFPDGPPECPYGTNYLLDNGLKRMIPHSH